MLGVLLWALRSRGFTNNQRFLNTMQQTQTSGAPIFSMRRPPEVWITSPGPASRPEPGPQPRNGLRRREIAQTGRSNFLEASDAWVPQGSGISAPRPLDNLPRAGFSSWVVL